VLENRKMTKTFGPKRGDVKLDWRKLHEELSILCTHSIAVW
jgi:hypothetical protein